MCETCTATFSHFHGCPDAPETDSEWAREEMLEHDDLRDDTEQDDSKTEVL